MFKKIGAFLKRLFTSSKKAIEKYIEPSILVVEAIKGFMNTGLVQIATDIIPGQIDNVIAAKINERLPDILMILRLTNECKNLTDRDDIIKCAIEALKKIDKKGRNAFYISIASMLAESLSDGKLSWNEALHLAQFVYQEKYKKP